MDFVHLIIIVRAEKIAGVLNSLLVQVKYCHLEFSKRYTLFTNPSARAGYDTRSIFKRSSTGLNSEFSLKDLRNISWSRQFTYHYSWA